MANAGARLLALDVTDDASMIAAVDPIVRDTRHIDVSQMLDVNFGAAVSLQAPFDNNFRVLTRSMRWCRTSGMRDACCAAVDRHGAGGAERST